MVAAVAVAAATVDLVTKMIGSTALAGGPVELPGPLALRLVHNPGVAFGQGTAQPAAVTLGATTLIAAVIAVAAARGMLGSPIAAGMVVGGAFANVADRLAGGTVVDLFDLGWWPTFNVADIFITTGAVLIVLTTQDRAATPPAPV